jgi:hypothetical protein
MKGLAIFHHNYHNMSMKVVENDKVISGMLRDELKRCQEMIDSALRGLYLSSRKAR